MLRAFALGTVLVPVAVVAGLAPYVTMLMLQGAVRGDPMLTDAALQAVLRAPWLQGIPAVPVVALAVPAMHLVGLPRWAVMSAAAVLGAVVLLAWLRLNADPSAVWQILSAFLAIQLIPMAALTGAAGALFFGAVWRRWRPACSST